MATKIHPTAIVSADAVIGQNVEIGPYAIIGPEVKIGDNCYIGPHCVLEYAELGKGNHIVASAFIGTMPQDFSYHGEKTRVTIGDNNIIREGCSIHRGSKATALTSVGSGCMLMANSHIGHDCRVGNNVVMVNSSGLSGHCEVGDKVIISGLAGMHQFVRIGPMAMVAGGCMVGLDLPPYCRCQGDRAKLVGLNVVGMKRNGISPDSIRAVKNVYKLLFLSGLRLSEAITRAKAMPLSPEAQKFVEFCEHARRGIMRPRMKRTSSSVDEGDE